MPDPTDSRSMGKLGCVNVNTILDVASFLIHTCFHHTSLIYFLPPFRLSTPELLMHISRAQGAGDTQELLKKLSNSLHFPGSTD